MCAEALTRDQYRRLKGDPELAAAIDELRDRDILMPFQKRGPRGEETFYRVAPWFQDVIGPALVFTGHETASSAESERIADKLREIDAASEPVTSTASHKALRPGAPDH